MKRLFNPRLLSQSPRRNTRESFLTWALLLLLAFGLKLHYRLSDNDSVRWILLPTAVVVELYSGSSLHYVPGEGYFNQEHRYVINKSCAGINFLVTCLLMSGFCLFTTIHQTKYRLSGLLVCLLGAFVLTVFVNSFRIWNVILFQDWFQGLSGFSPDTLHLWLGMLIYCSFLLLYYILIQFLISTYCLKNEKVA